MSLTLLTPGGGAVVAAALLPLGAAALAHRRTERVRRVLRLRSVPPDRTSLVLLALVPVLLGLAATQPALTRTSTRHVRLDAAVYFVLDVSRSMQAARSPHSSTRLAHARAAAIELRDRVPDVPAGVATMTDRIVPLLFPSPDVGAFDSTVRDAVRSEIPPALELAPVATSFDALGALGTQGFFSGAQHRRVVVLLTDGESEPFDASSVADALGDASLVVVRFWSRDERVWDGRTAEPDYRPDPTSAVRVSQLTAATGGRAFDAGALGGAADAIRRDVGSGSARAVPGTVHHVALAPWLALAALVPLGLLCRRRLLTFV